MKKIAWCWVQDNQVKKVESRGKNITDAFLNLSDSDKQRATNWAKWFEINGRRL